MVRSLRHACRKKQRINTGPTPSRQCRKSTLGTAYPGKPSPARPSPRLSAVRTSGRRAVALLCGASDGLRTHSRTNVLVDASVVLRAIDAGPERQQRQVGHQDTVSPTKDGHARLINGGQNTKTDRSGLKPPLSPHPWPRSTLSVPTVFSNLISTTTRPPTRRNPTGLHSEGQPFINRFVSSSPRCTWRRTIWRICQASSQHTFGVYHPARRKP